MMIFFSKSLFKYQKYKLIDMEKYQLIPFFFIVFLLKSIGKSSIIIHNDTFVIYNTIVFWHF